LAGPTGVGKTKTVESLAGVLHGQNKYVLKIDCGEFQMDHEVAKLIGAPPGYLGHRETVPVLSQAKLNAVSSEYSSISLILFDEIEKASPAMTRLLLGILDKGTLRLGDGAMVNFDRSAIFLTTNLGAEESQKHIMGGGFGFAENRATHDAVISRACQKNFSPEFMNRLDAVLVYKPLSGEDFREILKLELTRMEKHVRNRLIPKFNLNVSPKAFALLLAEGTSARYGARELKRVLHKRVLLPIARLVNSGVKPPEVNVGACGKEVCVTTEAEEAGYVAL
jgi:ATP-dependent Clp protease ATP-binding subunit ClpA